MLTPRARAETAGDSGGSGIERDHASGGVIRPTALPPSQVTPAMMLEFMAKFGSMQAMAAKIEQLEAKVAGMKLVRAAARAPPPAAAPCARGSQGSAAAGRAQPPCACTRALLARVGACMEHVLPRVLHKKREDVCAWPCVQALCCARARAPCLRPRTRPTGAPAYRAAPTPRHGCLQGAPRRAGGRPRPRLGAAAQGAGGLEAEPGPLCAHRGRMEAEPGAVPHAAAEQGAPADDRVVSIQPYLCDSSLCSGRQRMRSRCVHRSSAWRGGPASCVLCGWNADTGCAGRRRACAHRTESGSQAVFQPVSCLRPSVLRALGVRRAYQQPAPETACPRAPGAEPGGRQLAAPAGAAQHAGDRVEAPAGAPAARAA